MLKLRDYQENAIQSTYDFWISGKGKNPVLILPTGAGKSLIIAKLCEDVCRDDLYSRVLILTHTKELIVQNSDELKAIWEDAPIGIHSSGLNKKDLKSQIIFAGIQTFINNVENSEPFDLIIVDEAHLISTKDETRYAKVFKHLISLNEKTKIIGLTATPYRYNGGYIYGKNKIFCGVSYEVTIKFLIDNGYLVKPITKGALRQFDLSDVKIKANGEFDDNDLARVVEDDELINAVVNETIDLGKNRNAWLVFATNIKHGELLKSEFEKKGVCVDMVTGQTDKKQRQLTLDKFKNGKLKCLLNVGVLTTGFNAPICDLLVVARATTSTSLWVQMVGRGLRLYEGKENCLILDFGENTLRHGTLDNIQPIIAGTGTKKKKAKLKDDEIRAKECPECQTLLDKKSAYCTNCNYIFPVKPNHKEKNYDGEMFESEQLPIRYKVDRVLMMPYTAKSGDDCVKINYYCGITIISEYVKPNNYFGKKYLNQIGCVYTDINDIVSNQDGYKKPKFIIAKKKGKYMTIESKIFFQEENHCCSICINCIKKEEKNGYKTIEKYECLEYKCELDKAWIDEKNECEKYEYLPF